MSFNSQRSKDNQRSVEELWNCRQLGLTQKEINCTSIMHDMYFHFDETSDYFLFRRWEIKHFSEFVFTCLFVFVVAFMYEMILVCRELALHGNIQRRHNEMVRSKPMPSERTRMLTEGHGVEEIGFCTPAHICQTFIHIMVVITRYFLMLVIMTLNGYLCLSVLAGSTLGYFFFAWKKTVIVNLIPEN
ncbi:high affinity copper uptake protein 1-like [Antedon mediterranea]|uniref:high affinity copper uptake protein 1-like n=1 Tax=Antedon mediterranea TaxID=105859 RepID=UPI003AF896B7